MNLLQIFFLLMLATTGFGSLHIELDVPTHSAQCLYGFRADKDEYLITAKLGPYFPPILEDDYAMVSIVAIAVGAAEHDVLCAAFLGNKGDKCTFHFSDDCYCDHLNAVEGSAWVVSNRVAKAKHSLGTVRALVHLKNGSTVSLNFADKTLAGIYGVDEGVLKLYVNDIESNATHGSCGSFRANEVVTMKLCCTNAPMPCYPKLVFNNKTVAGNLYPCVSYEFTVTNEIVKVSMSYSVCVAEEPRKRGFCTIEKRKRIGSLHIELDVPTHSAECLYGFRADKDEYLITAKLGPYFSPILEDDYAMISIVAIAVGAAEHDVLCAALLGNKGDKCTFRFSDDCYCDHLNAVEGSAWVVSNRVAKAKHSLGTVRALVHLKNGSTVSLNFADKTLAEIYGVDEGVLKLYVNDIESNATHGSCGSFRADEVVTMKLCCTDAPMPCYPKLVFNNKTVADNLYPCVSYEFTVTNEIVNVSMSYSVCVAEESREHGFCTIGTPAQEKWQDKIIKPFPGLGILAGAIICALTFCWCCWWCCWRCCFKKNRAPVKTPPGDQNEPTTAESKPEMDNQ